jgi:alpha-beta hydrolase superfamily lysophospholipase
MPMASDWSIPGYHNHPIIGSTHTPFDGPDDPVGVMLICHGFKGYKDYGFFPHLAEAASAAGLIAHRFNFSHSGMTNNIDTFELPDLFEIDTWRKQSADINAVIAAVGSDTLPGGGQHLPLAIFGHSRGGLTALLNAGDPGASENLAAVIAAASPSACSRLDPEQKDMLKRVGRMPSPSSRTGQTLYVGRQWQDEIDEDPTWHDPCRAIAAIQCPVMIIQGNDDTTVHASESQDLHQAKPDATYLAIDSAGHTFNATNPLPLDQAPPPETQQMIDATCGFAVECCKS